MKLATQVIGTALAATALAATGLIGLGSATAVAATPHPAAGHGATATHSSSRLGGDYDRAFQIQNSTKGPLTIYTYLGSDWNTEIANPAVGTQIATGAKVWIYVKANGGGSDAIGLRPATYTGNLGLGISQDHADGMSFQTLSDSTLAMSQLSSGNGYSIISISDKVAYSEKTILGFSATLDGLHSTGISSFTCPSDHPWLVDQGLAPGRIVPNGVAVDEPGSVGVSIPDTSQDKDGRATGWDGSRASATNWDVRTHVVNIYGHCTNDPAQSYQG